MEAILYGFDIEWFSPQLLPFVLSQRPERLDSLIGFKPRAKVVITEDTAETVPSESLETQGPAAETNRSLSKAFAGHDLEGGMEMLYRTTYLKPLRARDGPDPRIARYESEAGQASAQVRAR